MSRPNLVFIHVDQMHADAVSAFGNPHVKTPNLDRMAESGTAFRRAYCAMPQCCPSRASWYTGRMSKEHGVPVNGLPIDRRLPDTGSWLRQHGDYDTFYTGKWHIPGRNPRQSFTVLPGGGQGEPGDASIADSAVGFLRERPRKSKPFFLNIGFMNPHDCCFPALTSTGPGKYGFAKTIEDSLPPLPDNFLRKEHRRRHLNAWTDRDWRYYIWHYYRLVEMVDAQIGRVYDALARLGHLENTVLLFMADHGDGLAFHGNVSKGYLEDEAWRVPCMVVAPGRVPEGKQRDDLVSGIDMAATVCDYAEVPPLPKTSLTRSWKPILEGKESPARQYVVGETSVLGVATGIRSDRYKAIFKPKSTALYDMKEDPLEKNDLAADPKYADTLAEHERHFVEYLSRIELYRPPKDAKISPGQRRLFPEYLRWYESVLEKGGLS